MTIRTCKCGITFDGYNTSKHCSNECKRIARNNAVYEYNARNKEKVNANKSVYKKSTVGRLVSIVSNAKRRANMNKVIHLFTLNEWRIKVRKTCGICPKCKKYVGLEGITLDHIYPISKAKENRTYRIEDIQPLCLACNISKFNKME